MGIEFTRNQKLVLLAIMGMAIIGISIAHIRNAKNSSDDVVITEPNQADSTKVVPTDSDSPYSRSDNQRKVVFQVAGCVNAPGVYTLPYGSRIYEAIKAAGGARPNADMQSLNLAAKIEDASKIIVPEVGQFPITPVGMQPTSNVGLTSKSKGNTASKSAKFSHPGEGLVHINSASVDELQRLPGVGPSTAQKIIDYRTSIGGFKSPEQVLDVKGIGPKKWEKMRLFVAL